ncbi:unnamed protein product [Symbiodinium microadriaticum]|nr:unnamed protein product [Symbiodinium microadriaticum]
MAPKAQSTFNSPGAVFVGSFSRMHDTLRSGSGSDRDEGGIRVLAIALRSVASSLPGALTTLRTSQRAPERAGDSEGDNAIAHSQTNFLSLSCMTYGAAIGELFSW